jgi:cytochrome c-type biogenesis protein CcmF
VIILAVLELRGHAVAALGLAGGAWVVLGALVDLGERIRLFRVPLGQSFRRLFTLPRAAIGAALGHLGFGVTVLGVAGMTLAVHTLVVMQPGQSVALGGYDWRLNGIHDQKGPDYAARVASVTISRDGHKVLTLNPERRFFATGKVMTDDAAIRTNGIHDLYATFAGENKNGGAEFRFNVHPFAPEIWLGGFIMLLGGGISLTDRRFRVGAPSRRRAKKPRDAVAA